MANRTGADGGGLVRGLVGQEFCGDAGEEKDMGRTITSAFVVWCDRMVLARSAAGSRSAPANRCRSGSTYGATFTLWDHEVVVLSDAIWAVAGSGRLNGVDSRRVTACGSREVGRFLDCHRGDKRDWHGPLRFAMNLRTELFQGPLAAAVPLQAIDDACVWGLAHTTTFRSSSEFSTASPPAQAPAERQCRDTVWPHIVNGNRSSGMDSRLPGCEATRKDPVADRFASPA
jgi:hypothetical protein